MLKKKEKKTKKKWSKKKKILLFLSSFLVIGISSFLFLFYGPWGGFRNFWITSAMTTMNHRYLATWFYSDETIQKVLASNSIIETNEISDASQIKFRKYTTSIYRNEYEKEVLNHEEGALYKVIDIKGDSYQG